MREGAKWHFSTWNDGLCGGWTTLALGTNRGQEVSASGQGY